MSVGSGLLSACFLVLLGPGYGFVAPFAPMINSEPVHCFLVPFRAPSPRPGPSVGSKVTRLSFSFPRRRPPPFIPPLLFAFLSLRPSLTFRSVFRLLLVLRIHPPPLGRLKLPELPCPCPEAREKRKERTWTGQNVSLWWCLCQRPSPVLVWVLCPAWLASFFL